MDRDTCKRAEERLKALDIELSPEEDSLQQVCDKAFLNVSESKETLETIESEQHGGLEYAASSIDTDLNLIKKEKGQDTYRDLLGHINELEEIKKELLAVEEKCANSIAFLEWVKERQEKYDIELEDLEAYHEEANNLGAEAQRLLEEIQHFIDERIEVVERFHQNVESDQERAWQGSSKGLEYAFKQLQAIHNGNFDSS